MTRRGIGRCGHCGRDGVPTYRLDGRLCGSCYHAALRRIGVCSQCDNTRLLPSRRDSSYMCAACAGISGGVCATCGANDRPMANREMCRRCANRSRLAEVLCGSTTAVGIAARLIDSLSDAHPWAVTRMLAAGGDLITELRAVAGRQHELNHENLDKLTPSRRVEHLRQRLIGDGLLPARHHQLGLFDRWVREFVASLPAEDVDRQTVTRYATWHHRRHLAAKADNNTLRASSTRAARGYIRAAACLLAWLAARDRSLATCRQADLDDWFSSGPTTRARAVGFIVWARTQRLCRRDLRVPTIRLRTPDGLAHNQRVALISRLLYEQTIALSDRVAGLLVALYAQPVTRISRLRTDAVINTADQVAVRFDTELVELPAPFDDLIRRLVDDRTDAGVHWLFPGITPGQPVSSQGLAERVRAHGVTRAARVAAFHDLVHKVPSPVLAGLIGYNPHVVAVRASALAAQWDVYAALRAQVHTDDGDDPRTEQRAERGDDRMEGRDDNIHVAVDASRG